MFHLNQNSVCGLSRNTASADHPQPIALNRKNREKSKMLHLARVCWLFSKKIKNVSLHARTHATKHS